MKKQMCVALLLLTVVGATGQPCAVTMRRDPFSGIVSMSVPATERYALRRSVDVFENTDMVVLVMSLSGREYGPGAGSLVVDRGIYLLLADSSNIQRRDAPVLTQAAAGRYEGAFRLNVNEADRVVQRGLLAARIGLATYRISDAENDAIRAGLFCLLKVKP